MHSIRNNFRELVVLTYYMPEITFNYKFFFFAAWNRQIAAKNSLFPTKLTNEFSIYFILFIWFLHDFIVIISNLDKFMFCLAHFWIVIRILNFELCIVIELLITRCNFFKFAGILRYKVDFQSMQLDDIDNEDFDLDDY